MPWSKFDFIYHLRAERELLFLDSYIDPYSFSFVGSCIGLSHDLFVDKPVGSTYGSSVGLDNLSLGS